MRILVLHFLEVLFHLNKLLIHVTAPVTVICSCYLHSTEFLYWILLLIATIQIDPMARYTGSNCRNMFR